MFTKFSRSTKRATIMCAAAIAIVVGVPATAHADDETVFLSDIDGRQLGYTKFTDATDQIKICDTQRDGHSVTARIRQGSTVYVEVSDGSDAGCNTRSVSLVNNDAYMLEIEWNGPGNITWNSGFFA
ncbi:hypothetical protein GCM10029976_086930 [Kribbella albertanoniae]|uniref:Uncharacterized protein n=1 Tax=Kribbella albertanoniae TaxID=1266829 RepID=A0A4R4QIP4_9ACTN|nr:hypothetical protein [Kribbella albertanoniae]TDC35239.1 hypothetical protein E1261_01540 [Kribbella albertanoniae]